ncbi:PREDICTED: baculoviral IAP repeat-containing protein 2-like [Cyphomyrmex costatus]|uniref:baculoviral IAP repeat-containing protein 2-like n=1 Tax=Cyphomyrmex costatus TaxID=456900 RepID=UPI0008524646|nr:PREDICTED: baculoviral IAP repeat-containing protein 2-like [Cyphomyrmex costatus]
MIRLPIINENLVDVNLLEIFHAAMYRSVRILAQFRHPCFLKDWMYLMDFLNLYRRRLATYEKWPKSKSQAEKLAAAGFCYLGNSDQTICSYCDGRLKNWEPNDDPWVEHAKWFHYCHHLIISKGTEFINNITGTSYIKIISTRTLNDTMEEKCKELDTSEKIDSESSQNLITAKKPNTEASCVSHEASSEKQRDQGLKDIKLSDNIGKDTVN